MDTKNIEISQFEAVKMASDIMKSLKVISLPLPKVFPFDLATELATGVILLAAMHLRNPAARAIVYPELDKYGPEILRIWELTMRRTLELSAKSDFMIWDREPEEFKAAEAALRAFRTNKS